MKNEKLQELLKKIRETKWTDEEQWARGDVLRLLQTVEKLQNDAIALLEAVKNPATAQLPLVKSKPIPINGIDPLPQGGPAAN